MLADVMVGMGSSCRMSDGRKETLGDGGVVESKV